MHRIALTALAVLMIVAPARRAGAGQGDDDSEGGGHCTISATAVGFGSYNVFSSGPTDSTGTITYRCRGHHSVAIGITRGSGSTFNPRSMSRGGEQLTYNLYLDAARTSIWGDATGGSQMYVNVGFPNNTDITLTVYARIPPGQDVSAGTYTDSVAAIVLF
jgi:spore coat protein U-like protein